MEPHTLAPLDGAPGPLFQYDQLDFSKRCVRLLRILPNSESGILQCELTTVSIINGVENAYNALSYEWGLNKPPFYWLRVNSGYLRIRQNLYTFLLAAHAKRLSEPRFRGELWIDAICIDQENILERGHQVKQMGDIYSRAAAVLVWLGPCTSEDTALAADVLHDLVKALGEIAEESFLRSHDMTMVRLRADPYDVLKPGSKMLPALMEMCNRTYWTRMWIVQEIILARKVRLILGDHMFSWVLVKRIAMDRPFRNLTMKDYPTARIVYELSSRETPDYQSMPLCEIVCSFSQGICSDIRDRVYAVLALVPSGKWFPVDYSTTREQLFCSLVLASYNSTTTDATSLTEARTITPLLPYPLDRFNLRNVTPRDLLNIVEVSASLCISYSTLADYLASKPDLRIHTLIRFRVTRQTTTILADNITEQSYTFKDCPPKKEARFPQLTLILRRESDIDRGSSDHVNCKTVFVLQPHRDNPIPGLYVFTDETTFYSFPVVEEGFLLLPFEVFIFLVGTVHKILYLSQNDLRHIKQNGGYSVPGPPMYGRDITLNLNSIPLN
jgi:hypothetical protein